MAIKGTTKNIAINPTGYKELNPEETFAPYHIDLRNGKVTDAGYWEKRNGYAGKWNINYLKPIDLLIPVDFGYAVTEDGKIYKLYDIPMELTGQMLLGANRPTWTKYNDLIIVCDGNKPVKIDDITTAILEGTPPRARFVDVISNYCIMAGHSATEFKWSASGNPENWETGDSGFANTKFDGDSIRFMKVLREKVYFFKENAIEIWYNRGGSTPFVRLNEYWIDKGCGADYSVVEANNTLYWFGNDGDFYLLNNITPQVISKSYRSYLNDKLNNPADLYGFDFRKENCIRWFSPVDGLCIKYDYLKGMMSEDNTWGHGQFERMLINSYMELNKEQYFGDYEPTGKIYHWSKDYKDDNGNPIRVYRDFKVKLTENGHNARINRCRFRFKRGVATAIETNPQAFIRWRLDDGVWGNYEYVSLGSLGDRNPYIDIFQLGVGRDLEMEIIETDAVDFLLTDIFLTSKEFGN